MIQFNWRRKSDGEPLTKMREEWTFSREDLANLLCTRLGEAPEGGEGELSRSETERYIREQLNRQAMSLAPHATEEMRRKLAEEIHARRNGLNHEESAEMATYHPTYVRAKKHRDQDRARLNGMVIALTYWLGAPLDMTKAEQYIEESWTRRTEPEAGQ